MNTQEVELSHVDRIYKRATDEIYQLTLGSENVWVTKEHPFYVIDKGWVKVKDLKIGDKVKTLLGTDLVIKSHLNKEKMNVFNIEVMGNHNYFITKNRMLVHNKYIDSSSILDNAFVKKASFVSRFKYFMRQIIMVK